MEVPYLSFDFHMALEAKIQEAFNDFLRSQWYVLGEGVKIFEKELSAFHTMPHAVGVASGLDALIIALKVLDIGHGDEVIVPSNTYIATWLAVTQVGAVIVPVEPDLHTYNIDPQNIEQAISEKTKAIIPVHLYGLSCDMKAIMDVANKNGLFVIEDNAQAIGALHHGQRTGTYGHINAFSFYPGKNLGALGDAGAIVTTNLEWADRAKSLRNYGSAVKYYNEEIGMNSRLDELQARLLSVKLPHIDQWNQERKAIADRYLAGLSGLSDIILPAEGMPGNHVFHIFSIRSAKRDALQAFLKETGIHTMIHYPVPPHLQKAYRHLEFRKGDFPLAEEIAGTQLSLPIYPGLSSEKVDYVMDKIREFFH